MLANKIKEARVTAGLSKAEVARKLEMPYTTYDSYERGKSEPKSETLKKIAQALGVSTDYLLGNTVIDTIKETVTVIKEYWDEQLEQFNVKLSRIGGKLVIVEDNGYYIEFPQGRVNITMEILDMLNESSDTFLRMQIEQYANSHPESYKPNKSYKPPKQPVLDLSILTKKDDNK